MAKFLVQVDSNVLDDEEKFVRQQLDSTKMLHSYELVSIKDIQSYNEKDLIPIGTIDFVHGYLRNVYGISRENPVEIPKYLRTEEFLKRTYFFTDYKGIPRSGKFFLKDASQLKNFGEVIVADYFITDELFDYKKVNEFDSTLVLPKDHIYLVSSLFNIKAEYRVYVIANEIVAMVCYNGDCTVLPDVNLLKKAVTLIEHNEKWLRSYTIDVMVGAKGTAIIEIHNFASVGLYTTLWGSDLLYAYRDGFYYLVNDNKELEM